MRNSSARLTMLFVLATPVIGCGIDTNIVTFGHALPSDAKILVAQSGPFSPDQKLFVVFEASAASIESFALSYSGSPIHTFVTEMDSSFAVGFGADDIREWDVQNIKNGRYYRKRTKKGTGYLLVDMDRNRVYLQR